MPWLLWEMLCSRGVQQGGLLAASAAEFPLLRGIPSLCRDLNLLPFSSRRNPILSWELACAQLAQPRAVSVLLQRWGGCARARCARVQPDVQALRARCTLEEPMEELTHTCNNPSSLGWCSSKAQEEPQKIPEKKNRVFHFLSRFPSKRSLKEHCHRPRRVARQSAPLERCFCLPEHPLRGHCPGEQGSDQRGSDWRGYQRLGGGSGGDLSLCRVPLQESTERR